MTLQIEQEGLAISGPQRKLGLASAIAAVAGESIAVGIFLTPAGMAKSLGSPVWLLIVWLTIGILAVCGAMTYGELAARFPRDGGHLRLPVGNLRTAGSVFVWMDVLTCSRSRAYRCARFGIGRLRCVHSAFIANIYEAHRHRCDLGTLYS